MKRRIGFVGRRALYDAISRVVKGVSYVKSLSDRYDIVFVDASLGMGFGVEIDCMDDACILAKALPALINIYGGSVGVDLGTSWVGIAHVAEGDLIIGARISADRLDEILNALLTIERGIDIYLGGTPYIDPTRVIKRLGQLCRRHRMYFVDELEAAKLRGAFRERFPNLVEDVLDAVIFTYVGGITLKLC